MTRSTGKKTAQGESGSPPSKPVPPAFDGSNLLHSVLALPLLELVREDFEAEEQLRERLGDAIPKNKKVLLLNAGFPGGLEAAKKEVQDLLLQLGEPKPPASESSGGHADIVFVKLSHQAVERLMLKNQTRRRPVLHLWPRTWDVIIDVSLHFDQRGCTPKELSAPHRQVNRKIIDPRAAAKAVIATYIKQVLEGAGDARNKSQYLDDQKSELSNQYAFARLSARNLNALVRHDHAKSLEKAKGWRLVELRSQQYDHDEQTDLITLARRFQAIHRIWPDFELKSCVFRSSRTVKADAAQNSFSAFGEGITWAVIDSGIDWRHPHFALHDNLDILSPYHMDFSGEVAGEGEENSALIDGYGHGTHVAGIIAGQQNAGDPEPRLLGPYLADARMSSVSRERVALDDHGDQAKITPRFEKLGSIAGIAPRCKLVSLKVLDNVGMGKASNVISAIAHIQRINGHGRNLKIHGVNISLGHEFDPLWFACGHSPLCVEVNRLVKSGVVVVVAAGNTGYGSVSADERVTKTGLEMSINDPGNADLAVTVGSTHRDAPYRYGVSYFSSKGPTGDGRIKPDLVAPGERIVSAAVPDSFKLENYSGEFAYVELSGTSMAAPHVSGAIAAFLSIRNEFIGEAEKVKDIFKRSATDLGRERYFQGAGMVDLLRAIQSV